MRAVSALLLALGISACGSQDDFDQRFNDREAALQQSAQRMEQEMTRQLSQAAEADKAMGVPSGPVRPPVRGKNGEGRGPEGRDSLGGPDNP